MSDDEANRPTDDELRLIIRRLIPKVDLEKTGIKAFTKLVQKECGDIDLSDRKKFINNALTEAINEMDSDDEESDDSESEEERKKPKKKKAAAAKIKKVASSGAPSGRGKGLSVKKEISPELADFLGQGSEMARTDIVKSLWEYIKSNDLQNPDNKREIILDDKMKAVFGCDRFTMFTMNKYIACHIHPFKTLDLTPKPKSDKPKQPRKRKRATKGSDSDDGKKKRKPKKPGLQPPYRLSEALQAVVGTEILPRPQVVSAIWTYIKKKELQNPDDKREILCDKKLKAIMDGNDRVTMFSMNRYISKHLIEKLDKSLYKHEEEEEEEEDDEEEEENSASEVEAEEVEEGSDDDDGSDDEEEDSD